MNTRLYKLNVPDVVILVIFIIHHVDVLASIYCHPLHIQKAKIHHLSTIIKTGTQNGRFRYILEFTDMILSRLFDLDINDIVEFIPSRFFIHVFGTDQNAVILCNSHLTRNPSKNYYLYIT